MDFSALVKRLFAPARTPLPGAVDCLVAGLGNIGSRYQATRHNAGFMVAEALVRRLAGCSSGRFGEADFSYGTLFSKVRVLAVKPRTLMNRSGDAVDRYLAHWRLPASRMLVIVDDYNLPLGKIRARSGGSHGGHNGLKSISAHIGEEYPRLRIGIGPLSPQMSVVDFVLGRFTPDEEEQLEAVVARAVEACELFAQQDIQAVMNAYNGL
jgi:PTH1 family peptidyl-tRNA hydrolase